MSHGTWVGPGHTGRSTHTSPPLEMVPHELPPPPLPRKAGPTNTPGPGPARPSSRPPPPPRGRLAPPPPPPPRRSSVVHPPTPVRHTRTPGPPATGGGPLRRARVCGGGVRGWGLAPGIRSPWPPHALGAMACAAPLDGYGQGPPLERGHSA